MQSKRLVPTIALMSLLTLGGCGGSSQSLMPAVEGMRLDAAQSDLKKAEVPEDDVEIIGGGALGVIDESNWNVCKQEPRPGEPLDGPVRLTVDRECGAAEPTATASEPTPDPEPTEEPTPEATEEPETFKMPKLVGENLQLAQDRLQARGSYVLTQEDALGLNRFQVLDSNWKVCSQKPRAGKRVPVDRLVVLDAVKLTESCP